MIGILVCAAIAAWPLGTMLALDHWLTEGEVDEWGRLVARVDDLRGDFELDRSAPIALFAEEMAARADDETRRVGPSVIAEAEAILRGGA